MGLKTKIDASLSSRLPSLPVGILLGTASPPRLLQHIPTPPTPVGVSPTLWASEHARLVALMCPGGLCVAARYVPNVPSAALAAASVAAAIDAPLVVCLASKGKLTAKEVTDGGAALRSADLRDVQGLASSAVRLRADVRLPPLPITEGGNMKEVGTACLTKAVAFVKRAAICVRDAKEGEVVIADITEDGSFAEMMGWEAATKKSKKASLETRGPLSVEVLLPMGAEPEDVATEGVVQPVAHLGGSMHVEALVMQDATRGEMLAAVRADMERSLRTKIQFLIDDEAPAEEMTAGESLVRGVHPVPVRVVAKPKEGGPGLPMTDYLMEGETIEDDVIGRFVEVLSWNDEEIESYQLLQTEQFAKASVKEISGVGVRSLEEVDATDMKALDVAASAPMTYAQNAVIGAFLMALLAIIVKELL